ncbi:GlcG/HbpS family heme-binding protein [Sphingomonas sp. IC081]|uniref:GlcG/HbpS family heme-binding protein n=1 Tax=Sphingomonas sp. IC081 TaxID=304378 RepID=UPI00115B0CB2|nr:heme-binding protein [Sphingomonas sp. IC081]QDK35580.1 heme-binding protein [Sphingomonas sp. IC081]
MDGVATIRTIGHDLAVKAVSAAVAAGIECGCPVVAAIIGAGGELVALLRASGAPFPSTQFAQDKAYTAASFRVPTPDLYEMISGNPALRDGIAAKPGIAMFGGGLPIDIGGECVGAIGVSGASEEIDTICANAGLAAIGATQH